MSSLFNIWHSIQHALFPWLEEELDPLTEKQQEFVRVIELAGVQKHMTSYRWQGVGRKRDDRLAIVKAFAAKAVYNFPTTKALIAYLHDSTNLRRLCGWESKGGIPSESTFSRAFAVPAGRRNSLAVDWGKRFTRRWSNSMPDQSLWVMSAVMQQQ